MMTFLQNSVWPALKEIAVAIIGVISGIYYLQWFVPKVWRRAKSVGTWFRIFINPLMQSEAGELPRAAVYSRLDHSLASSSVQWITFLRFLLTAGFLWRWAALYGGPVRSRSLLARWEPYPSLALCIFILVYVHRSHLARKKAEAIQMQLNAKQEDDNQGSLPRIRSAQIPDVFFVPAMFDIIFIMMGGLCLPGGFINFHLTFILPTIAIWLFENAGRGVIVALSICFAIAVQWLWTEWLLQGSQWSDSLYGQVIPQMIFWLFLCGFMLVMRASRRHGDKARAFFHTLAEAMPFNVFTKDPNRRFVYVNGRMLRKLRKLPHSTVTDLQSVEGKTDIEIGIEPDKAKKYAEVDTALLQQDIPFFSGEELSYEFGSKGELDTTKVPILRSENSVAYILGLTRDVLTERDPWFFVNVVGQGKPHCFFKKRAGKFDWVNEAFARDAGITDPEAIKGKRDSDLYEDRCAKAYESDDHRVIKEGHIEQDEWHQPKGRLLRRVHVSKYRIDGEIAQPCDSIRGYFVDIHLPYLLWCGVEHILVNASEKIIANAELASTSPEFDAPTLSTGDLFFATRLFLRTVRILNIGAWEFEQLQGGAQPLIPRSIKDLAWNAGDIEVNVSMSSVVRVARTLYRDIRFDIVPWDGNLSPVVDPNWTPVIMMGLLLFAAERAKPGELVLLGCGTAHNHVLDTEGPERKLEFVISVSDHRPPNSAHVSNPDMLAEHVSSAGDVSAGVGIHAVIRVAKLGKGSVKYSDRQDGKVGSVISCHIPQEKFRKRSKKLIPLP